MKTTEIIKDAFSFPSKKPGRFAIYLLLTVFWVFFAIGGIITYELGFINSENYLLGGIYVLFSLLIGIILSGYHISVIKSGIEREDEFPVFKWFENFITGFDSTIVALFYYMIPTIIVAIVGYDTNVYGNAMAVVGEFFYQLFNVYIMGNSINVAIKAISHTIDNLTNSLIITFTVACILFIIFTILQFIAQARLANTGSINEALNIFESAKDIGKIGVGKVIMLFVLILFILSIIEIILINLINIFPLFIFLVITFYILVTPYFILVTPRAIGLLYSDIA